LKLGLKDKSEVKPVLIVGAGPTGMTAAMELSRCGVPVRIVDKLPAPSTTSRALAVQARTLELFEQRGLIQEMLRIGNQGTAATIYGNGKCLGKVHLGEIKSRYNFVLLLSQSETERILREQLARQGVLIERGTEMINFAQLESSSQPGLNGGVKAVLRNSEGALEELEAAYLISAEGAHSMVRRTLNLQFQGKSLEQSYALADLHLDGDLPDDELSIFTAEHGFLAVFPMGERHFRFIATDPEKHAKTDDEPTLEELQKIYDEDSHIPVRLRDMTWSSRFRINSRMLHT
jgi:2-polyprenyl-6-methoxyphenol hydroxylase-like FAD-dependent oxidoreductase